MEWLKQPGDKAERGESVLVVESDKADMDVESFQEGYRAAVLMPAGSMAPVGETIGFIVETEAEIADAKAKAPSAAPTAPAPAAAAPAAPAPPAAPVGCPRSRGCTCEQRTFDRESPRTHLLLARGRGCQRPRFRRRRPPATGPVMSPRSTITVLPSLQFNPIYFGAAPWLICRS